MILLHKQLLKIILNKMQILIIIRDAKLGLRQQEVAQLQLHKTCKLAAVVKCFHYILHRLVQVLLVDLQMEELLVLVQLGINSVTWLKELQMEESLKHFHFSLQMLNILKHNINYALFSLFLFHVPTI